MTRAIVIPARWASSRFPGKPLALIAGRTLLARVIDLARRSISEVADIPIIVATDDQRVAEHALQFGVAAVITEEAISTGSGRVLAASRLLQQSIDHVINLQGDAPFIPTDAIGAVLSALEKGADIATPVLQLGWNELDDLRAHKRQAPFSGTTCVTDETDQAIWFSKQIIPAIRDEKRSREVNRLSPVLRHVGVYGYKLDALARFEASSPDPYELLEGLEQLRFLRLRMAVQAVRIQPCKTMMGGIDTPADLTLAERIIGACGDPYTG